MTELSFSSTYLLLRRIYIALVLHIGRVLFFNRRARRKSTFLSTRGVTKQYRLIQHFSALVFFLAVTDLFTG